MLRFEEYVARRKKEDRVNEFDIGARADNIRIFVNYVFEYFNSYVNVTEAEEKTVLESERINKFRGQVEQYDPEVKEWLVDVYSQHGHILPRTVSFILKKNEFFFLANTDQEFRSMSYECYSQMIRKYPFLRDQTELLFLLVKNYHQVLSQAK